MPQTIAVLAVVGLLIAVTCSRLPQLFLSAISLIQRPGTSFIPDFTTLSALVLFSRAAALFASLAVGFIFWSGGRILLRILELPASSHLESSAMALALGAVLWGELFFALGLAGLIQIPLLRAFLVLGAVVGVADCLRYPLNIAGFLCELDEAGRPWLALLAVHLAILTPYAFLPETFYDALEYHLGLPALALLRGRINPVPMNAFAGLPSVPSMIYGWALALESGGHVAHLLNFGFLAATVLVILGLARRLGNARLGGPSAVLFAMGPCVVMMAVCTGVELAGAFFLTAAIAAILRVVDDEQPKSWIPAGLILGAAMATKPLLWCLPAAALAAVWAAGVPKARKGMVWASIGACVVFVPWLLKNIVFYGNPIYPFFHAWFQPRAAIMPNWRYLGENTGIPWFSAPRAALAAWLRAPFVAASYNHDLVQYANPILFGLLPAGLCLSLRERKFKIMLCFTMAAWLPISLATDLPRYFIPIFPALSLAAAAATQGSRWWRGTIAACLAVLGFTLWTGILPLERLAVFTGQESESDYLEHSHNTYPGPLYAAARWIDNNASKDARVLVFGDSRGFQVERDYFSSSPKQMTPLELWANASADGNALNVNLARENVKYILINHAEILRGGLAFSFTATGESALDQFWARYMRKVFETGPDYVKLSTGQQTLDRWVAVYEVLTEAEAAKRHVADAPFAAYKMRPL